VMKRRGGKRPVLIRPSRLARYGWQHTHCQNLRTKCTSKQSRPITAMWHPAIGGIKRDPNDEAKPIDSYGSPTKPNCGLLPSRSTPTPLAIATAYWPQLSVGRTKTEFHGARSGAGSRSTDLLGRTVLKDKLASQQALAIIVYDGNIQHV
jgi:hypothetical protein